MICIELGIKQSTIHTKLSNVWERRTKKDKHRTLKLIRRKGLGETFKKTCKYDLKCNRPCGLIPNNILTEDILADFELKEENPRILKEIVIY